MCVSRKQVETALRAGFHPDPSSHHGPPSAGDLLPAAKSFCFVCVVMLCRDYTIKGLWFVFVCRSRRGQMLSPQEQSQRFTGVSVRSNRNTELRRECDSADES